MRLLIFFIFILLSVTNSFSQNNKLELGRQLYYLAVKNEENLNQAIEIFSQISKEEPSMKQLSNIYIGSLTMIKGKHAFWPHQKIDYVNEGLKIMDLAIKEEPNNIEMLFIYGSSCYYLPFFFNKKDLAINKFKKIINLLNDNSIKEYDSKILSNALEFIKEKIEITKEEQQIINKYLQLLSSNNG